MEKKQAMVTELARSTFLQEWVTMLYIQIILMTSAEQ